MNEKDASFLVLFLAPVKDYLADDKVSEILINGPNQIYIERGGKLEDGDAADLRSGERFYLVDEGNLFEVRESAPGQD